MRLTVHSSVAAELATVMDPTSFDTFDAVLGERGKVLPCRPISDGEVVRVVQALALPNPEPLRRLALAMIQEAIIEAASAASATDPLINTINFPALWLLALPVRGRLQRSCETSHVLSTVFTSDADFQSIVGMEAWPAPTAKSRNGMLRVRRRRPRAPPAPHPSAAAAARSTPPRTHASRCAPRCRAFCERAR